MKKLLTVMLLVLSAAFVNAATVSNNAHQHHSVDPLCRSTNNLPTVCKQLADHLVSPLVYSFACSFCPVCDENGQLVKCGENDLPANGRCCVDIEIDFDLLRQLPGNGRCKIDEGHSGPCGQCPVYYKKDHSCVVNTGELGALFPSCVLLNEPNPDAGCPTPTRGNSGKKKKNLTPVKPNSAARNEKGVGPVKTSSKGLAGKSNK